MREILGEKYYTLSEVAEMLGKTTRTVQRIIDDGRLKASQAIRPVMIAEKDIRDFLEGGKK